MLDWTGWQALEHPLPPGPMAPGLAPRTGALSRPVPDHPHTQSPTRQPYPSPANPPTSSLHPATCTPCLTWALPLLPLLPYFVSPPPFPPATPRSTPRWAPPSGRCPTWAACRTTATGRASCWPSCGTPTWPPCPSRWGGGGAATRLCAQCDAMHDAAQCITAEPCQASTQACHSHVEANRQGHGALVGEEASSREAQSCLASAVCHDRRHRLWLRIHAPAALHTRDRAAHPHPCAWVRHALTLLRC